MAPGEAAIKYDDINYNDDDDDDDVDDDDSNDDDDDVFS